MSKLLTEGCLGCRIIVERNFDIVLYLIPPIEQLFDIAITLEPPVTSEHDIIISLVREITDEVKELKKTDVSTGFTLVSKSKINEKFSDINFIDGSLSSIVNISDILKVPLGTFDSVKGVSTDELHNIPISDRFVIFNYNESNRLVDTQLDGLLLMKFNTKISSYPLTHNTLLKLFNEHSLHYTRYTDGFILPFSSNTDYALYYIGYLFVPTQQVLKFGLDCSGSGELEIDGQIVCSIYGNEGSNGNPDECSCELSLKPGWHRIIIRNIGKSGDEGIGVYLYDYKNNTWRLLTLDNFKQYFSNLKLRIPLYFSTDEILKSLYEQPKLQIDDSIVDIVKNAETVLFKVTTTNITSLTSFININKKLPYSYQLISGELQSGNFEDLINNIVLYSDGVVLVPDTNGNNPKFKLILDTPTNISKITMYIPFIETGIFHNVSNKSFTIKFYSSLNDESLIDIPNVISSDNVIGISQISYNNGEYIGVFSNDVHKSGYVVIPINLPIKIQVIELEIKSSIGEIRRLTIERPVNDISVIDCGNQFVKISKSMKIKGIPFDNLNLPIINKTKLTKQVAQITEYIAFYDKFYKFKILNNEDVYSAPYVSS